MPPDAKSPQPGKSATQDDENLPKVKYIYVIVKNTLLKMLKILPEIFSVVLHKIMTLLMHIV